MHTITPNYICKFQRFTDITHRVVSILKNNCTLKIEDNKTYMGSWTKMRLGNR
jgi:hypothetical protein